MNIPIERGKVVTVARGQSTSVAGFSLSKGLGVVFRHWRRAWFEKQHQNVPATASESAPNAGNDKSKPTAFVTLEDMSKSYGTFTVEYPEQRIKLPEAYRNMPVLLYDDETGHELCTSCFQCQRICPPQVIHMTQAKDPASGKPVPSVAEFIIEYDACMSCGFCAEVCPFDAIKMDHEFELSTHDHPSLTVYKRDLNRPVSYYESIAPGFWAEARERAYKKLATNMKRRPGAIGIAPHLTEKITAAQAQAAQAAAAQAPAAKAPAKKAAAPRAADTAAAPTDKEAKLAAIRARNAAQKGGSAPAAGTAADAPLPTDKEAKLAAIRARNAAKKGGSTPAAETSAEESPPTDDKAARLAAIRARNAAKKGDATPSEESDQPAAETPPANDKAARLAAIRARNAAQKATEAAEQAADSATSTPEAPASSSEEGKPLDEKAARLAEIRARNAARKKGDQE